MVETENGYLAGADERRAARTDTCKKARIIASKGRIMDCTIMNVSKTGALLKFLEQEIPAEFDLVIEEHDFRVKSARVWNKGYLAGICFRLELPEIPPFLLNDDSNTMHQSLPDSYQTVRALSLFDRDTAEIETPPSPAKKMRRSFSATFGKRKA